MARDAVDTFEELCLDCGCDIVSKHDEMFPPGYSIHEVGSCRMGDDPRASVLNSWNQSHDIRNFVGRGRQQFRYSRMAESHVDDHGPVDAGIRVHGRADEDRRRLSSCRVVPSPCCRFFSPTVLTFPACPYDA